LVLLVQVRILIPQLPVEDPLMFRFDQLSVSRPRLMGIVNVTPNSFSDGGDFLDPAMAAGHARELAGQGAAIVDLGAEASSFFRPGIEPVEAEEQIRRLLPVLSRLRDLPAGAAISVDTRSAKVAQAVLEAGAGIINDISAGTQDAELFDVVARQGAGVILMHISPGYPATPAADDADIVGTVRGYLESRARAAMAAGIAPERIALDPGIGFGKTMADNWRLALRSGEISERFAVVIGASRKRFLENRPPSDVPLPAGWDDLINRLRQDPRAAHPRDPMSAALVAVTGGTAIHRVHNVVLAASA
jgi:dihydropteroate synthase